MSITLHAATQSSRLPAFAAVGLLSSLTQCSDPLDHDSDSDLGAHQDQDATPISPAKTRGEGGGNRTNYLPLNIGQEMRRRMS